MKTQETSVSLRRRYADSMSAAPVILPFAAYVLWWLLGIGDFIWIIAGFLIAGSWLGVRGLRFPPVALLWVFFVLWVGVTIVMNDTPGRVVGALYRLLLYASAGLLFLHTFNARNSLPLWRVTRAMTWFLGGMTVVGYAALIVPQAVIRTPMSWIIPSGLASNELVRDMIVRQLAHWNPEAWVEQAVRPVAPFLYANTWGNVYSLVLPLVLLHLWLGWHTRHRWVTIVVVVSSIVPALSTLNRGMFVGLGVVVLWVLIQLLLRGRVLLVGAGIGTVATAFVLWSMSPLGDALRNRVESTYSTEDRFQLYRSTLEAALRSPLFGYGSPRPAEEPWLPSLGTQGQLWTVLYSHGFVGAALFIGFLVVVFCLVASRRDVPGGVFGGIILATLVETVFYGMMTGIMVTLVVAALALRSDTAVSSADRPGTGVQTSATGRPRVRR